MLKFSLFEQDFLMYLIAFKFVRMICMTRFKDEFLSNFCLTMPIFLKQADCFYR